MNPERSSGAPDQLPRVTVQALQAFEERPHAFKEDFTALLRENPALARAITVRIEEDGSQHDHKLAFARGALWMYTILREVLDTERIMELVGEMDFSDGDGDEDQPLSA